MLISRLITVHLSFRKIAEVPYGKITSFPELATAAIRGRVRRGRSRLKCNFGLFHPAIAMVGILPSGLIIMKFQNGESFISQQCFKDFAKEEATRRPFDCKNKALV